MYCAYYSDQEAFKIVQNQFKQVLNKSKLVLNLIKVHSISPDSVQSGRTCPANVGVRSCPVRKLISPVQLSPIADNTTAAKSLLSWFIYCALLVWKQATKVVKCRNVWNSTIESGIYLIWQKFIRQKSFAIEMEKKLVWTHIGNIYLLAFLKR
jgi:hypothetical protein